MIVKLIDFFRDRLKTVIRAGYCLLALLVVLDAFVDKHHAHTWIEHYPGFWAAFGFGACVVIILVSKWYGHVKWFGRFSIMTREDYYDR